MLKLYFLFTLLVNLDVYGMDLKPSGAINAKFLSYTQDVNQSLGQNLKLNFEIKTTLDNHWLIKNQIRSNANSLTSNLSSQIQNSSNEQFEIYEGDNYVQYKNDWLVTQLGYQTVIWGESFGFNYGDIINPKDLRETLYNDISDARRSLFLLNSKFLFSGESYNGSWQLLYSPQPRFDKNLPLELFTSQTLPQYSFNLHNQKSYSFFKEQEFGTKISITYKGFDTSIFYFDHIDRSGYYEISNVSGLNLSLEEKHSRISSIGASVAHSLYDFTLRADSIMNQNKKINTFQNSQLTSSYLDEINTVISLDSPTFNDYSFAFIYAQSILSEEIQKAFRDQKQQFAIIKISKNLSNEKSFDLSLTREFNYSAYALQSFINIPLSNLTELKIGTELYFGDEKSNLSKLKKLNNVFISLKNYFQL